MGNRLINDVTGDETLKIGGKQSTRRNRRGKEVKPEGNGGGWREIGEKRK